VCGARCEGAYFAKIFSRVGIDTDRFGAVCSLPSPDRARTRALYKVLDIYIAGESTEAEGVGGFWMVDFTKSNFIAECSV